jgi:hypothetical protein
VLCKLLVHLDSAILESHSKSVLRLGIHCGPHEVTTLAKGRILELRVGVDDEVCVANHGEVSSRGRESHILSKCFTDSQVFDVLWLDSLSIL